MLGKPLWKRKEFNTMSKYLQVKKRGDDISMHKKKDMNMKSGLCVINGATSRRIGLSVRKSRRMRLYCMLIVMGITEAKEFELYYVSNGDLMTSLKQNDDMRQLAFRTIRQEAVCHEKRSRKEACSDVAVSLEPPYTYAA